MKLSTVLVLATSALLASCGGGGDSTTTPTPTVSCLGGVKGAAPYPQVTMLTSKGTVVVEVYPSNAPNTVANFLQYVTDGFYKDKIFHRVISNFVVQGGGFNASLVEAQTRAAIKLEVCNGLGNTRGTIAMARTAAPDSATSQFFINVVDNPSLDTSGGGYAVFGKVVAGMDVVDAIKAVPTQTVSGFGSDVPVTPVVILSVTKTQ